jgi:hypothetical protein
VTGPPALTPERHAVVRAALVRHVSSAAPRRARRRLVVAVAALALLGSGTALAVSGGIDFLAEQERVDRAPWAIDRPDGARVEVAGGADWSFMAWQSDLGICVAWAAGSAESWGRACGPATKRPQDEGPRHLVVSLYSTVADAAGRSAVVGAVTNDVRRIEIELPSGAVLSADAEAAPAVTTAVRFFIARLEAGPIIGVPFRAYSFYGDDGRLLERFVMPRG